MGIDKSALKALRQERAQIIARAKEKIKAQNRIIKTIKGQMTDDGMTIPALAQATGLSSSQTLLYVATLKKYGEIAEGAKDGEYFKYHLATVKA
jgi:hypothetical protein